MLTFGQKCMYTNTTVLYPSAEILSSRARLYCTLLQGLTLISGTQTGCRRLDSYIEQKKFLACGPEFSVEFSAPPEFSGGVTEKYLSTGWARTFDPQITKQILYHCANAPLYL
jgi:hypothetical protein